MSMRLVQVVWNLLLGGLVVLRGGYHAPTTSETESLERDDPGNPSQPAPAGP
jgi:hypothetical protein